MEVKQYGNTVCIHFFIRPFRIEGIIKRVKKEKKKRKEDIIYWESMLEQQAALEIMERNKQAAQDLLRMKQLF